VSALAPLGLGLLALGVAMGFGLRGTIRDKRPWTKESLIDKKVP
jgi:hypothetical protein